MLLFVPAMALIVAGNNNGRAASDSIAYHERFIRALADSFPWFDLSNPLTATTPGYHIILATVAQFVGDSNTALRLVSMLVGCAFVGLVAAWLARRVGVARGVLFTLPLIASIYVVGSAAWLLPDNLAWMLVAAILFLTLREPKRAQHLIVASLLLVLLVCVRQVHIWAAAMVWVGGWVLVGSGARPARGFVDRAFRTLPWVLATVPAFVVLALFVRHWGGLTPPRFQSELQGVNLATPAFILLQVSVLAIGFAPWLWGTLTRAWRDERGVLVLALILGVLLAAVPETTLDPAAGRFSGWWAIVGMAPTIARRTSVLMLFAAPLGAVVLASALLGVTTRQRVILTVSIVAFIAAVSSNYYSWQRYHEPFLLVVLATLCALERDRGESRSSWRWLFPIGLVLLHAGITMQGLSANPVALDTLPAPNHRMPGEVFP